MKKYILLIIFALPFFMQSCDSTGLCTEPVTPKLQIGFSDLDILGNEEDINPPSNLVIYGTKDGVDIIDNENEESKYLYPNQTAVVDKKIGLVLDVERDKVTYIFVFNSNDASKIVYDTLQVSYTRNPEFVSLECGHKTLFSNVLIDYSQNYFSKIELIKDQIDNDLEQHLKIYLN